MRVSELLHSIAAWLESPNNEALLLSEYHEDTAKIVAESCVLAAALLKNAAEETSKTEPEPESSINVETVEELAALAQMFDSSGDAALVKQASALDELLLSIAAPKNAYAELTAKNNERGNELKKKYEDIKNGLYDMGKIADAEKAIEKSEMTKDFRVLEHPLSTRYCPDHAGVSICRIGDGVFQCELDKKVYDFNHGFTLNNGDRVPGSDVSEQTKLDVEIPASMFDTREGRLNQNR